LRPPALQRHRDGIQHQADDVPDQPGGRPRQGLAGRAVGDSGRGGTGRADRRSIDAQAAGGVSDTDLFAQQDANRRRSVWLVAGFIIFFAWVGFGGDVAFALLTRDAAPGGYHHVIPFIGIVATLIAGGICWYSWRFGAER